MGKTMAREDELMINRGLLKPNNFNSEMPNVKSSSSNDFSLSDAYSFYEANKAVPSPPSVASSGSDDALLCLASAAETLDKGTMVHNEGRPVLQFKQQHQQQPAAKESNTVTFEKVIEIHREVVRYRDVSSSSSTEEPPRSTYTGIRYPHEHQHVAVRQKDISTSACPLKPTNIGFIKGSYPKPKPAYTQIYKGVTIRPSSKYQAQIFHGKGQTIYLGVWLLETDAGYVFDKANAYFRVKESIINFPTLNDYLEAREREIQKRGIEILKRMKSYIKSVEDVDVKVNKILAKYAAKLGKSVPILY
ncbi:hypothetical protein ACHAXN_001645 [Cyclotella atomus]